MVVEMFVYIHINIHGINHGQIECVPIKTNL